MINKQNKICFVAGKTGGHILPCISLAQQKKENNANLFTLFFSTDADLDKAILQKQTIINKHITLPLAKFSSRSIIRYLQLPWRLIKSFFISMYHLYTNKIDIVISTGGLIAAPVCLAAKILRIPIELYELNAVPGKAIQTLAPLANTVYVCFNQATKYFAKYNCIVKPYPIRFTHDQREVCKKNTCKELNLNSSKKTLFIMGGSQGSLQLNNEIKEYIETRRISDNLQIIHQTGAHDQTDWKAMYANKSIPAIVFNYCDTVIPYYIAADLIISRAGAGMLFEILFFEKPSIIMPLEAKTTSHQIDNAYAMQSEYPALFTVIRHQEQHTKNTLHDYLDNFLNT